MYMYQARRVTSHVYVPSQESEQSCICIKPGEPAVMYMYQARRVTSHVYVPSQESDQSCICTSVLEIFSLRCLYQARRGTSHVHLHYRYPLCLCSYDFPIIFLNCSESLVFSFSYFFTLGTSNHNFQSHRISTLLVHWIC